MMLLAIVPTVATALEHDDFIGKWIFTEAITGDVVTTAEELNMSCFI